MHEKRKEQRVDFGWAVNASEGNSAYIRNISNSGCLLKIKSNGNKPLNISYLLPNSNDVISAECEIIWNTNNHLGIKFIMNYKTMLVHSRFMSDLAIREI